MTLYMLFAGLGILIYTGVACAESAVAGFRGAHAAFGLQFAFFLSLSVFLAAVILFYANRFLLAHPFSVHPVSTWRGRLFIVTLVFVGGSVAILIAATREPGDAPSCAGGCEARNEAITVGASIISPKGSQAVADVAEPPPAQAAGMRLFQELGCIGCHRPDATGIGPVLTGRFGRPVAEQSCGAQTVDEAYVREAILNPSATVAAGFPPVMPTFAGRVTEEELQALVTYVKSLSGPTQIQNR